MSDKFLSSKAISLILFILASGHSYGGNKIGEDYSQHTKAALSISPLDSTALGDRVSLYTGSVEFVATDINLTGNNLIPMSVGRRFKVQDRYANRDGLYLFGDWELDIPRLHGLFPKDQGWQVSTMGYPQRRCSVDKINYLDAMPPVAAGTNGGLFGSDEYWRGNSFYLPGVGEKRMIVLDPGNSNVPSDGASYHWGAGDDWIFSCLPATSNGVPGEGFLAHSPDGSKYWFDWIVNTSLDGVSKVILPRCYPPTGVCVSDLPLVAVSILPTKIEDRFGNRVVYSYDGSIPNRLNYMESNDGRRINFEYNSKGQIISVTDNVRTWNYRYDQESKLSSVLLPDGSSWSFNLARLSTMKGTYNLYSDCADPANFYASESSGEIIHPSGVKGVFWVEGRRHGRSYVPRDCKYTPGGSYIVQPNLIDAISINKKELSGPGISSQVWSYEYGPLNKNYIGDMARDCPQSPCPSTKTVTVRNPDGSWERTTFSNRYNQAEGEKTLVEIGRGDVVYQSTAYNYVLDSMGMPYPSRIGNAPCYYNCDDEGEVLQPLKSKITTMQGNKFYYIVNSFDAFAQPMSVTKFSEQTP